MTDTQNHAQPPDSEEKTPVLVLSAHRLLEGAIVGAAFGWGFGPEIGVLMFTPFLLMAAYGAYWHLRGRDPL